MQWQDISTISEGAKKKGVLVCRYGWVRARVGVFSHGTWWTNGEILKGEPDVWAPLPEPPQEEK